jgi:CRISPR-associated protein Csm3
MRCLLEQANGIVKHGDIGEDNGTIRNLFGFTEGNKNAQPSRLIVRDAMLTPESKSLLEESDNLDMPYTENKFENTIDRVKGTAGNPRQIERVPAGVEFGAEFVINVYGGSEEEQVLLNTFKDGIAMITNDYIGGSGSRGYGQIVFKNWKATQFEGPDWTIEKAYELGEI